MKVSYDFAMDDIWGYGKHVTYSLPKFRRKLVINVMLIPIMVCLVGFAMKFKPSSYLFYGVVLTVLYVFVLNAVLKAKVVRSNSGKGGLLGRHTIDLGLSGIKETLPDREESHSWNEIIKIDENKKYIFIHWSEMACFVIPKKAFPKEEDAKFFLTTAMKHFESASSKEKK